MVSDEIDEFRKLAARVVADIYAPLAEEMDRARVPVSREQRQQLGELGFLGIVHEERFGGSGSTMLAALAVIEEFAKVSRPAAFQVFEANTGPAYVVSQLGNEEQKQRWLPSIISGRTTMALAISEADAGSAATDMRTTATPSGSGYSLNGGKRWISNGSEADQYMVYCRMSDVPGARGIGAIVVDADMPGVSFGARERLMGFRGIPSSDVYFDDVKVPADNVIVSAGGFPRVFGLFSVERLGNASICIGIGQAALDKTAAYVQERRQFGKPLVEFQGVQLLLADMTLMLESARLLRDGAAASGSNGVPETLRVSLAKCAANEMAKKVTDMAIQLHGANGYTEEYGIERLHRDAVGFALAGGTPVMQRVRIVSELLGRRFDQRG
jgi:butyryl-CoA dehydrogenase